MGHVYASEVDVGGVKRTKLSVISPVWAVVVIELNPTTLFCFHESTPVPLLVRMELMAPWASGIVIATTDRRTASPT